MIGVISCLRRLVGAGLDGAAGQLRRYGVCLGDFLGGSLVGEIITAAAAVPILNVALGSLGRRHCREVFQIRVVVCIQLSIAFAAELTLCLVLAGGLTAGVVVLNGNRLFGREVKAVGGLCTHDQLKAGFFRRIYGCL